MRVHWQDRELDPLAVVCYYLVLLRGTVKPYVSSLAFSEEK